MGEVRHDSNLIRILPPTKSKFLLASFSTLLTYLILEIVLSVFYFDDQIFSGRYELDPSCGYRLKPDRSEGGIKNTNSHGFRDHEFSTTKTPNSIRILAIGDSFTYGGGALNEAYPTQLQQLLIKTGTKVEVINAGIPGYGTDQEYELLRTRGFQYEPDLVVLGFFVGNDLVDNLSFNENTVFDGELIKKDTYDQNSIFYKRIVLQGRLFSHRLRLWPLVKNFQWPIVSNFSEGKMPPDERWYLDVQKDRLDFMSLSWHETQTAKKAWENTFFYLQQIQQLCNQNKVPLVVLILPNELQVNGAILKKVLQFSKRRRNELRIDTLQNRLARFLKKSQIDFIDLLPVFRTEGQKGSLYIEHDTHLNAKGNRVTATTLADYLITHELLAETN